MKKLRFACLLLIALCLVFTGCRRSALVYEDSDKYIAGDATISEPVRNLDLVWISGSVKIAYHPESTILLSTHLIADIEPVLDEAIFLRGGRVVRHDSVDHIREVEGKSVDEVFREIFRTIPYGGMWHAE